MTGSNLTGACKLVFKVARNERNDSLFVNSDVPGAIQSQFRIESNSNYRKLSFFRAELLIEGIGRASPIEDPEACIYGYGAVRFLTNAIVSSSGGNGNGADRKKHKTLGRRLARHGVVPLMVLHLQIVNEAVSIIQKWFRWSNAIGIRIFASFFQGASAKLSGPPLHALYQLSDALRALSKIPLGELEAPPSRNGERPTDTTIYPPSVYNNTNASTEPVDNRYPLICEMPEHFDIQLDLAAPHLVRAAEICIDEAEVQSNIIRTLSVLSEQEPCCDAIAEMAARIGILLGPGPLPAQQTTPSVLPGKPPIAEKSLGVLSRIGYILGNIMARSDLARVQFYNNDVAMEFLLQNLETCATNRFTLRMRPPNNADAGRGDSECDTVIDVVIKLIRVVANMSVNPEVGYGLANCHPLGSVLLSLLLTINKYKLNFVSSSTRRTIGEHLLTCNCVSIFIRRALNWKNCCWPAWEPFTIFPSIKRPSPTNHRSMVRRLQSRMLCTRAV